MATFTSMPINEEYALVLDDPGQVAAWTSRLGISEDRLRTLVALVGTRFAAIEFIARTFAEVVPTVVKPVRAALERRVAERRSRTSPIRDAKRVDLNHAAEVADWCRILGVDESALRDAVFSVGEMSIAVAVHLSRKRRFDEAGRPADGEPEAMR